MYYYVFPGHRSTGGHYVRVFSLNAWAHVCIQIGFKNANTLHKRVSHKRPTADTFKMQADYWLSSDLVFFLNCFFFKDWFGIFLSFLQFLTVKGYRKMMELWHTSALTQESFYELQWLVALLIQNSAWKWSTWMTRFTHLYATEGCIVVMHWNEISPKINRLILQPLMASTSWMMLNGNILTLRLPINKDQVENY